MKKRGFRCALAVVMVKVDFGILCDWFGEHL